jgi:hypothetical protein
MLLSPDAMKEFQAIYRQEFGEDLLDDEAKTMAQELLTLFRTMARPLPPEHAHRCPVHRPSPSSPPSH